MIKTKLAKTEIAEKCQVFGISFNLSAFKNITRETVIAGLPPRIIDILRWFKKFLKKSDLRVASVLYYLFAYSRVKDNYLEASAITRIHYLK